jgi:7,8-dihydro-6-hydroxymethylpterin-pyrophosphokinase
MSNPRPIDIDILLLEDKLIKSDQLEIPHKELTKRNFVLVPLLEIAPNLVHPVLKVKLNRIFKNCKDESIVRKIKDPISL